MKSIFAPSIPPRDRHKQIFDLFFSLAVGEQMMLINDHDPKPLHYTFLIEYPDTFTWVYQTEGPELFEVVITKILDVTPKTK